MALPSHPHAVCNHYYQWDSPLVSPLLYIRQTGAAFVTRREAEYTIKALDYRLDIL